MPKLFSSEDEVFGHDGKLVQDEVVVRRQGRDQQRPLGLVKGVERGAVARPRFGFGTLGFVRQGRREAELELSWRVSKRGKGTILWETRGGDRRVARGIQG